MFIHSQLYLDEVHVIGFGTGSSLEGALAGNRAARRQAARAQKKQQKPPTGSQPKLTNIGQFQVGASGKLTCDSCTFEAPDPADLVFWPEAIRATQGGCVCVRNSVFNGYATVAKADKGAVIELPGCTSHGDTATQKDSSALEVR